MELYFHDFSFVPLFMQVSRSSVPEIGRRGTDEEGALPQDKYGENAE
jgi:hypothetical protein